MPKYWLISNRNNGGIGTERNVAGLSYFVSDTEPLTDISISELYDWLLKQQQVAIKSKGAPEKACKAKVSVIADSMGNYLLQKAMAAAWTRKNQPLLASLINQLVMAAADVDNNLFDAGAPDNDDGGAIANFTYRITAFFCPYGLAEVPKRNLRNPPPQSLGRDRLCEICGLYFCVLCCYSIRTTSSDVRPRSDKIQL